MKVAVNAGHFPGLDPGALGLESSEAEIVRDIAKVVCTDLDSIGYEVTFIQLNNLQDICDASDDFEADVFLSIHCNAFDKTVEGTETFHSGLSWEGYELAKCIQHQLLTTMHSQNRGLKQKGYWVLVHTDAPAALAEIDFIDNPKREQYIREHIAEIGHALSRGITDYFNEMEDLEGKA